MSQKETFTFYSPCSIMEETKQDIIDLEATLSMKISRFLIDNSSENLLDIEDSTSTISASNELVDSYQETHVKLRCMLEDFEYEVYQGKLNVLVNMFMVRDKEVK